MTSLTDRYIAATLRNLPPRQRPELELELRAAIADAQEHQDEAAALAELGDPARLAASYSDRPLHLIGPTLYLDFRRVLAVLLSSVVPLILLTVTIAEFRADDGLVAAIATAASASVLVAMHIAIWTTVLFALIERTPGMRRRRAAWTPASLPELPAKRIDLGSIIGGSTVTALIAAALIVAQASSPGPISPTLWNSGALLIVVVFAAVAMAFDVIGYYVGWSIPQALSNLVLSTLFTTMVIVAIRNGLFNPVYFDSIGWPQGTAIVGWIVIVVIVLLGIGNVTSAFRRARPTHQK